jgi:hypothetical protein
METPKTNTNQMMEWVNNLEMLLEHTEPIGDKYGETFNIRRPILSKEQYLAYLERIDLFAMDKWVKAINLNLHHGFISQAMHMMIRYLSNIRSTPSIDGTFIKRITSQEVKYHQEQVVHDYQHQMERKKLFGGNK